MAYIEPNTVVKILAGVPFDPDYENTMYFASASAQETYMNGKVVYTINKNSYQRKNRGTIKVGLSVDISGGSIKYLYNANYMMFKNSNFENKWFYAFVTKVEYVNNNTVEISYKIDVIQTWVFAIRFNQCLIEREHTVTDNFGENLIPENLEYGDYIITRAMAMEYTPCVCVVTTYDEQGDYNYGEYLGGYGGSHSAYFSGLHYEYFTLYEQNELNAYLEDMTDAAKINGVVAIFMCPYEFKARGIATTAQTIYTTMSYKYSNVECLGDGVEADGGYVPRNKKLLTYPYNMLYCTNYQGDSIALKFEYFSDPTNIELHMFGNSSTNPGLIFWPKNYNGKQDNFEEGLTINGFPMCAWAYDTFKAWLAQNAGSLIARPAQRLVESAIPAAVSGAGAVNAVSGMSSALSEAIGLLGEIRDHYVMPPTNIGNGGGNLQYQAGNMTFMYCKKHIRPQFAKIIDSFFDMYGYATHRVGTPNLNARPCYSYVKTVGASIDGDLPVDDVEEIERIFDRGVRFWKTSATFGSFDPAVNNNRPT